MSSREGQRYIGGRIDEDLWKEMEAIRIKRKWSLQTILGEAIAQYVASQDKEEKESK